MNRIYTGIGSRKTPKHILEIMKKLGYILGKNDFTLRSGGAKGADTAFETGCDHAHGKKEIFLPWKNFNNNPSHFFEVSQEAIDIARKFHPHIPMHKEWLKKFHGRNSYQVLGKDLQTPTDFVLCYSPGCGGTEQALRVARYYEISIFNLYGDKNKTIKELQNFINNNYGK